MCLLFQNQNHLSLNMPPSFHIQISITRLSVLEGESLAMCKKIKVRLLKIKWMSSWEFWWCLSACLTISYMYHQTLLEISHHQTLSPLIPWFQTSQSWISAIIFFYFPVYDIFNNTMIFCNNTTIIFCNKLLNTVKMCLCLNIFLWF